MTIDAYVWIYTCPLWAPLAMLLLYAVGIQYERGGLWRSVAPITFTGFLFDVFLQYTLANVYFWEIKPKGEFTISMRLGRLLHDAGWRGNIARRLAWLLNQLAPTGRHING